MIYVTAFFLFVSAVFQQVALWHTSKRAEALERQLAFWATQAHYWQQECEQLEAKLMAAYAGTPKELN